MGIESFNNIQHSEGEMRREEPKTRVAPGVESMVPEEKDPTIPATRIADGVEPVRLEEKDPTIPATRIAQPGHLRPPVPQKPWWKKW